MLINIFCSMIFLCKMQCFHVICLLTAYQPDQISAVECTYYECLPAIVTISTIFFSGVWTSVKPEMAVQIDLKYHDITLSVIEPMDDVACV